MSKAELLSGLHEFDDRRRSSSSARRISCNVVMPWHRPAGSNSMIPLNAATKNAYRGVNVIMLWMAPDIAHHPTGAWASYKQWQAAGAQVRKGERATPIIFYRQYDVDPPGEAAPP